MQVCASERECARRGGKWSAESDRDKEKEGGGERERKREGDTEGGIKSV